MNNSKLDALTQRLPSSELAKIIKRALAYGREERPFTEMDLVRALSFARSMRIQRKVPVRRSSPPPANTGAPPVSGTEPVTGTHRIGQGRNLGGSFSNNAPISTSNNLPISPKPKTNIRQIA